MIKFTKNFYQKGVRKKVISLGLDSGSSMIKAVLFKDDHIIKTKMIPTSISPRKSLEDFIKCFLILFPCLYSQFPLRNQEHRRQREYHMIKDKDNKGDKIHDGNCSNRRCIYRY